MSPQWLRIWLAGLAVAVAANVAAACGDQYFYDPSGNGKYVMDDGSPSPGPQHYDAGLEETLPTPPPPEPDGGDGADSGNGETTDGGEATADGGAGEDAWEGDGGLPEPLGCVYPELDPLKPAKQRLWPVPNDVYTVPDAESPTGLRLNLTKDVFPRKDPVIRQDPGLPSYFEGVDGFATYTRIAVPWSGPLDPAALPATPEASVLDTSLLMLVNIDTDSPGFGARVPIECGFEAGANTLWALPFAPLDEGTSYAFIMRRGLVAAPGHEPACAEPAPFLQVVARAAAGEPGIEEYQASPLGARAVEVYAQGLASPALAGEDLLGAVFFTTQTVVSELAAMRAASLVWAADAKPTFRLVSTRADSSPNIGLVAEVTYPSLNYQDENDRIEFRAGEPQARGEATYNATVYFPKAENERKPPYPLAIAAHGLSDNRYGIRAVKDELCRLGFAVVSVDAKYHGDRARKTGGLGPLDFLGLHQELDRMWVDGGQARDNFRQTVADLIGLVRAGEHSTLDVLPEGNPDGVPDIDTNVGPVFIGQSLGGMLSVHTGAVEPRIRALVNNVGGGGVLEIFFNSTLFSAIVPSLVPKGADAAETMRFGAIIVPAIMRADPIAYAPYVITKAPPGVDDWRPRPVLFQAAREDTIVPNSSSVALARAYGMPLVGAEKFPAPGLAHLTSPVSANVNGMTAAFSQFDTVTSSSEGFATHGNLINSPEAAAQFSSFFAAIRDGKTPTIKPAYAP